MFAFSLFSDLRTMSGTALMYMLANMFLTQLFYVVGVGGVQVIYFTVVKNKNKMAINLQLLRRYIKITIHYFNN